MKYRGWPESGELVVGEVTKIEDFGVFVDLQEYEDKEGLIHVSEVASGWIKNIRDHVREGQTVVCKVLSVDESSKQIDLSYKDVNDHQRSEKIQEWKNEQKAEKWLSIALGEDIPDEQYERVIGELLTEFETVYSGFERAAIHGEEVLDDLDLEEEEIEAITETARENVSVPYVTVSGYIDLECFDIEGVDAIQEALKAATGNGEVPDEVELEVTYVGAPEYRIRVQAPNYKAAEKALEESAERAHAAIAEHGGNSEFHRDRRSEEET